MHKYEPCINERRKVTFPREGFGVASLVATTQEPNRISIDMLRQSMSQLEDFLVLSVDTSVLVLTP